MKDGKEIIPKTQEKNIVKTNFITDNSIEISKAAIGALVGVVVGGPVGAVLGSITPPVITLAQNITQKIIDRRKNRLENIMYDAILYSNSSFEDALNFLNENEESTDILYSLLSYAANTDESFDRVFSGLISELVSKQTSVENERLLIIADSVKNLRLIHFKILQALYVSGGEMSASNISCKVGIPEIELRGVVRELELRGMIKDLEVIPIRWELRELGFAVAKYTENKIVGGKNT